MSGKNRLGIPTLYSGVLMRSRTEARWAAFFDAVQWPWAYEPLDLAGYIPDFVLQFEACRLLVEVKSTEEEIAIAKAKIEASGWEGEAMIVISGATPDLGAFLEQDAQTFNWGDATAFYCLSCGRASVHSSSGDWRCRICDASHGNAHVGAIDTAPLWAAAGNRVQWRAA